ncbi:MAG: MBL fold metallo-hydrolase [archaeon]
MKPILDNIYCFREKTIGDSNSYLLMGEKNILIDSGGIGFEKERIAQIEQVLKLSELDLIINTHCHGDHIGGNKLLKEAGAKLAVHKLDAPHVEVADEYTIMQPAEGVEVDIKFEEGEKFAGFEVIHTPGHSEGSICLYDSETKTLISGDTIFPQGVGRTDFIGGNIEKLHESLKKLRELDVENLLAGHMEPIIGGAREAIESSAGMF